MVVVEFEEDIISIDAAVVGRRPPTPRVDAQTPFMTFAIVSSRRLIGGKRELCMAMKGVERASVGRYRHQSDSKPKLPAPY